MATRSNACTELTRLWLESRHGLLSGESLPVPVPYGLSDIDLIALHPREQQIQLPNGQVVGPRLIVEVKDEHDFDPTGKDFGKLLRADVAFIAEAGFIPTGTKGVKFSMLRQQHFETAADLFGTRAFDRVFVVHAIDQGVLAEFDILFATHRIHWVTIREVVRDLVAWYRLHPRPCGLRHTLTGDLLHLLVGFCGLSMPQERGTRALRWGGVVFAWRLGLPWAAFAELRW